MATFVEECQLLLKLDPPPCSGVLRMKNALFRCGEALGKSFPKLADLPAKMAKVVPWDRHFVVLHDEVLYIFKGETSKKPERRIRLRNYSSVQQIDLGIEDIPWPFRLIGKGKEEVFAATDRIELEKWINALKDLVSKNVSDEEFSDSEDDDYEKPTDYKREDRSVRHSLSAPHASANGRRALPAIPGGQRTAPPIDPDEDQNKERSGRGPTSKAGPSSGKCEIISKVNGVGGGKPVQWKIGRGENTSPGFPISTYPAAASITKKPSTSERPVVPSKPVPLVPHPENLQIQNKKIPPLPSVHLKPTVKIYPQPKKPVQVQPEVYESADQLPYEINATMTDKAMWLGSSEDATSIMTKLCKEEGAFLLRTSTKGDGYTIHVICSGASKKFGIKKEGNTFSMSGYTFDSLEELLAHFKDNCLPNNDVRLGKPYSDYKK